MAARSHGNGTNFDWLRKSCDISTCDLSPDRNPEKYGRPMKSSISTGNPDTCNSNKLLNRSQFMILLPDQMLFSWVLQEPFQ